MAFLDKEKPWFANVANNSVANIVNGTGAAAMGSNTNTLVAFTASAEGSIVDSLRILSDDTAAKVVLIQIKNGSSYRPLMAISVPANSGTNGTAAVVDALSHANASFLPVNNQGKRYIRLKSGDEIIVGVVSSVTAAKNIWVCAMGADYEA